MQDIWPICASSSRKLMNYFLELMMPTGPRGERRPIDVIGAAVRVLRTATGE